MIFYRKNLIKEEPPRFSRRLKKAAKTTPPFFKKRRGAGPSRNPRDCTQPTVSTVGTPTNLCVLCAFVAKKFQMYFWKFNPIKMNFQKPAAFLLLLFVISCTHKEEKKIPAYNPNFSSYITSFTSGVVSKKSAIQISLALSLDSGQTFAEDLFEFEPEMEGQIQQADANTIQYIPDENLKAGQVYTVKFHLDEIAEVPDSMKVFEFGFQVLRPMYEWGSVQLLATPPSQMKMYKLQGSLLSADEEDLEEVRKILSVKGLDGKIKWRNGEILRQYVFEIDSIERKKTAREIELLVNKDALGTEHLDDKKMELPALGDFRFLNAEVVTEPSHHVRINFSDPIDAEQDLSGLITLEGAENLRFEVENTGVLVFMENEIFGKKILNIFQGIENIEGYKFKDSKEIVLEFFNEKPQVKILGDGTIVPTSEKLMLPFQAISLNAVDVKVVKVPQSNLLQFFQNNDYQGNSELYRVGVKVAEKKIDLRPKGSLNDWNTYSLDLSEMMKPEPGALYRVYLSFQKDYSVYHCEPPEEAEDEEDDYWYYDDEYYYRNDGAYNHQDYSFRYPRGYRWRERENPCHVSYYYQNNFATRNVLASNLGLIAKKTETGLLDFTVSNLLDTKPISGAEITLYSYQGLKIKSAETDGNGFAQIKDEGRPFFAVAEKNGQKTYLKLQGGGSLSLSAFEVGGASVKDGIKGFVYGERGVWRPGDSLFLNFILEDAEKVLPNGHPIHFELIDPQGKLVDRRVVPKKEKPIYAFYTKTNPSAVTGNYTFKARVGDRIFQDRIRIETVKPNRLKIDFGIEDQTLKLASEQLTDVEVNWLTGIPAGNSKLTVTANVNSAYRPFEKYPNYSFQDPARRFYSFEKEVFTGEVDENGKAQINMDFGNLSNPPGMLRGRFVVKAFEGGGDFSTEYFDAKIAPYDRFVGLELPKPQRSRFLETDKNHTVKIRTVDAEGNPVDVENLEVKVYRMDWHWWYHSQQENIARFLNNEVTYLISKGSVSTKYGEGSYNLRVNYPRWGRVLVRICDPNGGHCTGQIAYFDWPEGTQGERPELAGATILNFETDKERYEIGEEITARIPVSKGARVLLSQENGMGILKKEWREADGDILEYTFKATAEMAPNIYLNISLLQPHSQTENDRPMRLYGIIPIEVYDPATELRPQISTPEVWRPETKVKVQVSEKDGKPMSYTLAVVDDGLLNLTKFKTPDPWKTFYAKEALGVSTWDMFNDVLGAFGGRLEQVFAIGGDEDLEVEEDANQNRFKPMVRHIGPFYLDGNQKVTHEIEVPNYVGSVRVMVVAANENEAYGKAEKDVKVRQPLMVLTSLPRLLSPGDEVTLPVTVFAMEDQVKNVSLSLKSEGEVDIVGSTSQNIRFDKIGEQVVDFKLKVPENRGFAKVRVEAKSGRETAYDEVDLKVRLPNPPITVAENFVLKPGQDTLIRYQPVGVPGSNALDLEASTIPAINLNDRLKFLFQYPYGCTEQVVSRAFPLLYLDDLMEVTDEMKAVRRQNIRYAMERIYERQSSSGGILYWPGASQVNDYITSYAGHFMMEAKENGFQVTAGALSRWKKYQQNSARSWRPKYSSTGYLYNNLEQSYRLYTLALEGSPEVGAMNRLRETRGISNLVQWQLAEAYFLIGQKETAQKMFAAADANVDYEGIKYYGGRLRNDAIQLMVLDRMGMENRALPLARGMAKRLNSNRWYTTHDLAFALKALIEVYGDFAKGGQMKWSYSAAGEDFRSVKAKTFVNYEVQKNERQPFEYRLKNEGEVPVNFVATRSGIPIEFDVPARSSNLSIDVSYRLPNGNALDVSRITQGQDFEAVVTVTKTSTRGDYDNMALAQLLPTGWEIINTRLLGTQTADEGQYTYRDIRDDRVYTFFNLNHRKSATFVVKLNATYAGKYWLPPVECEEMYNNEIMARTSGRWVEVVR